MELRFGYSFSDWGVYPRTIDGLRGIIFSPIIHGDVNHLIGNSFPLLVLGTFIIYFFREISFKIIAYTWLITGLVEWLIARPSYHIGASGIIYGFAAFIFVSGIIRRDPRFMALALIVVYLYGSMIWGILPTEEKISWEGHLAGALTGIVLAIAFRKQGPQRDKYQYELEEEEEEWQGEIPPDEPQTTNNMNSAEKPTVIRYIYRHGQNDAKPY